MHIFIIVTSAAKSTRIFEKDVRWICSYLSFGIIDRPLHFPLSLSSTRCFHEIVLPWRSTYCIVMHDLWWLAHRVWAGDTKQFRVVLIKCGGSEKKYRKQPSGAWMLGTLLYQFWCVIKSNQLLIYRCSIKCSS